MKTISILTGDFPPTNIVGALRPFRLAKHICRRGWRVIVFTHPPRQNNGLDKSLLQEIVGGCEIHFVSRPKPAANGRAVIIQRAVGVAKDALNKWVKPDPDIVYVPAYYREFRKAYNKIPSDVVLTTSPAHSIHIAGLLINKKLKLPWIVDFRDPWDSYLKTGVDELYNPFERMLKEKIITHSDAVISTSCKYRDNLKNRHADISPEKFVTITNSFDQAKTSGEKKKSPEKFIVCYTGIFYASKDPYGFFRALGKWFDKMSTDEKCRYKDRLEIHLIGSDGAQTRHAVHEAGLDGNVFFFKRMSHERAIEKTRQADMALISTGMGEKTRPGWLPSKLFEYLGCRVPVLAFIREGEMAEIIRKTNSGHVLTSEDPDQLAFILSRSIDRKFEGAGLHESDAYNFEGIEQFEEARVMGRFIDLVEKMV